MLSLTEFEDYVRDAGWLVKLRHTPPTLLKLVLRTARPLEPGQGSYSKHKSRVKGTSSWKVPSSGPGTYFKESFRILSNSCLMQNTRESLKYLDFLWCSLEFTYCHNQNSSYVNSFLCSQISVDCRRLFSTQLGAISSTPAARSAYKLAVTKLCCSKSLYIFTSLLNSFCLQHFSTGPSANNLNKAFLKYST